MIEPISINIDELNLPTLFPMMIAIIGGLVILSIDLFVKNLHKSLYVILSILVLLIDLGTVIGYSGVTRGFFDVMLVDGIAILTQIIIIISTALFVLLTLSKQRFHEYKYPEYFALFLFMTAGFQFMVASDSLILIFIGLETASLALYTLIAMHNRDKSIEAAIKYFTMGAVAASFIAFGSMIFYALTGSIALGEISASLVASDFTDYLLILVAVVFILGGLGFKLSLVPFHTWAPDVYEGANSALAGYISIVPKIATFVVALRFFEIFVSVENSWVELILYIIVVLTMTIANMAALVQNDVKRMLAFSSISHAGFVMSAILVGTSQATQGLFIYWILFAFTNFGAFAMLWANRSKNNESYSSDHPFERFAGLVKTSPVLAVILGLFMLSLAGIPPFSLFWGKMFLLSATINADYIILAIIMALNSAIAIYYYLKLIVYMFLKESNSQTQVLFMENATTSIKILLGITVFMVLTTVFYIDPLLEMINMYVEISGY
ncbi:MAG: NADH-quinone oxidoreductase subunit NuoN [Arcobacter sp.]|nr:MAG: NADH-quinone oxidoreductase subunit NuoN [Arcobacter sp.]